MTEKTIEKIHNNLVKAWNGLLDSNTKIVENHGYSEEDAKILAFIITTKILENR